jgi:hypothetical protein
MRHSDYRGLEKDAHVIDEEYDGMAARSVDDHYNYPVSPNSSGEFMTHGSNRQEHSLFTFVAPKIKKPKTKKNKNSTTVNKVDEEEPTTFEEKPKPNRGRLASRESSDIQFDMEPEDYITGSRNEGKLYFFSSNEK